VAGAAVVAAGAVAARDLRALFGAVVAAVLVAGVAVEVAALRGILYTTIVCILYINLSNKYIFIFLRT
jgi:hypothetical protein